MKTTMKQQLQILTFADAGWETKRKYKQAIANVWFPHPQDVQFDFARYDYRVVLPPLPEGYDIMPLGGIIKKGSETIWIIAEGGRTWTGGQADYGHEHNNPSVIFAVKRQPTTKEVPLTAGDLPRGAGLWLEFDGTVYQVLEIQPGGVVTHDDSIWRFTLIHNHRGRFSVDRSEWVNGWKEVEE